MHTYTYIHAYTRFTHSILWAPPGALYALMNQKRSDRQCCHFLALLLQLRYPLDIIQCHPNLHDGGSIAQLWEEIGLRHTRYHMTRLTFILLDAVISFKKYAPWIFYSWLKSFVPPHEMHVTKKLNISQYLILTDVQFFNADSWWTIYINCELFNFKNCWLHVSIKNTRKDDMPGFLDSEIESGWTDQWEGAVGEGWLPIGSHRMHFCLFIS